MRVGCDTGGTFTDLIVEESGGDITLYKAASTPDDPPRGVIAALELAAQDRGEPLASFLSRAELLVHGTTHAINAIVTGAIARTAFITTRGHRDMLVLREGGRSDPFDHTRPYTPPYIPRSLTFEAPERVDAAGGVVEPLDEAAIVDIIAQLKERGVQAVAVCLLWSIANPAHELRIGAMLAEHMPGVPVTLSHQLNPTLREYRRASATCIDASLKPLMGAYLSSLERRLADAGFGGRLLMLTSEGGMADARTLAAAPIHSINSGPSAAPVAGSHFAALEDAARDVIVADTGGTTFDVSLVRDGRIPWTRETWIGAPYAGHMTGFPSVDVQSVGAGGGSLAWVDAGAVLHVGPQSAGAIPGPACYARGGTRATLTDACVVLGYIDPDYFLGGDMQLDAPAAAAAVQRDVADPLGIALPEAAAAIVMLATEHMVQAIGDLTINQGIDPTRAVMVAGGGAAGLNCVAVARRLGCETVILPEPGAALSAAGAMITDVTAEFRTVHYASSTNFDYAGVDRVLSELEARCKAFIADSAMGAHAHQIEYTLEARYPRQVWEVEILLPTARIADACDLEQVRQAFHAEHRALFAFDDPDSAIEMIGWGARVRSKSRGTELGRLRSTTDAAPAGGAREVYYPGHGRLLVQRHRMDALPHETIFDGPAIVESAFTTIVIDPAARFRRTRHGSLQVDLGGQAARVDGARDLTGAVA